MHVADIGCGEQPLRFYVEELEGRYTGVDIQQNVKGTVEIIASILQVPRQNRSFDVILCTEVLEHVSDTYHAFAELARLLKPGGRLILTVPFAYPLHEEPFDFVRMTPYQIYECARQNDMVVEMLETSGNELEVMATIWSNLWSRMCYPPKSGWTCYFRSAFYHLVFTIGNGMAQLGSWVFGNYLPRKYYLNVLAVLAKTETPKIQL